jgi:hypothetical protein
VQSQGGIFQKPARIDYLKKQRVASSQNNLGFKTYEQKELFSNHKILARFRVKPFKSSDLYLYSFYLFVLCIEFISSNF